jgi:hypothetical protein
MIAKGRGNGKSEFKKENKKKIKKDVMINTIYFKFCPIG